MNKYKTLANLIITLELLDIKKNTTEYQLLRGINGVKNKTLKSLVINKEDVNELANLLKRDFENGLWEIYKPTMPLYERLLKRKRISYNAWLCWDDKTETVLKNGTHTNVIGMYDYNMWSKYLPFLNSIVDKQLKEIGILFSNSSL